jgi:hypothetical protein
MRSQFSELNLLDDRALHFTGLPILDDLRFFFTAATWFNGCRLRCPASRGWHGDMYRECGVMICPISVLVQLRLLVFTALILVASAAWHSVSIQREKLGAQSNELQQTKTFFMLDQGRSGTPTNRLSWR